MRRISGLFIDISSPYIILNQNLITIMFEECYLGHQSLQYIKNNFKGANEDCGDETGTILYGFRFVLVGS